MVVSPGREAQPSVLLVKVSGSALPSLIAQAAAPSIGTALIEAVGVDGAMAVFVALAAVNVILASSLFLVLRRSSRARLP